MVLKSSLLFSSIVVFITSVLLSGNLLAKEIYTIRSSEKLNFKYFVSGIPISGEFYIDKTSFTMDFNKEEQSRFYIKIDIKKITFITSIISNCIKRTFSIVKNGMDPLTMYAMIRFYSL